MNVNFVVTFDSYTLSMLRAHQITLVQETFALVLPVTAQTASYFYRRLFDLAPETRALFHNDMDEQGQKLFQTLAIVVDSLDNIDTILPTASSLATRHLAYGVREDHYMFVGLALIDALRHSIGGRFNADVEQAWVSAYEVLANYMISQAYRRDLAA